jgi:anhydro-N-acetylmuramic acid kinase
MSGTSMDGIDAALIELPSNKLIHGITKKYSEEVRSALVRLMSELQTNLAEFCQLNTLVGRDFASAVHQLLDESGYSPADIQAIGSHGQTVCHDTSTVVPYTLQLGCGHTISTLTGITVVADFRTRDLVNGGQGAPLAPLYHQELFKKYDANVAIVNVGGIANVTFLNPGHVTKGWDVGPGNCLMDAWIKKNQAKNYDEQGRWASQGNVIHPLLMRLLSDPFFRESSPKSIGKEYFSLSWLTPQLESEYTPVDVQATLLSLTAWSIAESIVSENAGTKKLYLCGGGVHNTNLLNVLSKLLPQICVTSIHDLGVSPDYLEAMMFAWLAAQTIQSIPVDLNSITGSKDKAILGAIYPIVK